VLSFATHNFDLVVEGAAVQVTDPSIVAAMAARWADNARSGRRDTLEVGENFGRPRLTSTAREHL
jgi:hypothetical protein